MPDDEKKEIPVIFLKRASDVIASTDRLSGSEIIRVTASFAVDNDVEIPHPEYPFQAANKRTALLENLKPFESEIRYKIILELLNHRFFDDNSDIEVNKLKHQLISRYSKIYGSDDDSDVNLLLIEETRHWLSSYENALPSYEAALEKYNSNIYSRNILDDLRLSLELLLKEVLSNSRSLENNFQELGRLLKAEKSSTELTNMLHKLIGYYSDYQNTYVKHNDNVNEDEMDIIIEITSSFMKHIAKIHRRTSN